MNPDIPPPANRSYSHWARDPNPMTTIGYQIPSDPVATPSWGTGGHPMAVGAMSEPPISCAPVTWASSTIEIQRAAQVGYEALAENLGLPCPTPWAERSATLQNAWLASAEAMARVLR
jgi:hypothetical protein